MPKDALTRRKDRIPAGFCQEQTPVLTEQFSSMEHDAFHVSYLSDKTPEALFHGQAVKTVAYLTVSTAQDSARILMGSYMEHITTNDEAAKDRLMKGLDGFLERDRALFDLASKP